MVGVPSWLRTGAAKRMAGWKRWAKQKPMPTSRTQRATPSGPRSITTPSVSSTSTDPHFDDAARPPCLATRAPDAAVTIAAMVETFTVPAPSPPVPQVSTSGTSRSERSTRSANSSIVRTRAASSAAVSPLARRPTANAAIWASVASPDRISDIACSIRSSGRSSRRSRRPMTSGHSAAFIRRMLPAPPCGRSPHRAPGVRCVNYAVRRRLADESAAFPFVESAPDALLLPGGDRVLEARFPHRADRADRLGGVGRRRRTPPAGRRSRGRRPGIVRTGASGSSSDSCFLVFQPGGEAGRTSSNTPGFGCSSRRS